MSEVIGIDPMVDYACKLLLGSPDHPAITIHFLNSVIGPKIPITEVKILNPIVGAEFDVDKVSILDILAVDAIGRRFNIEVQRTTSEGLGRRLVYYATTQVGYQLEQGEDYRDIRAVVSICILDAVHFRNTPECHNRFRMRTEDGLELTDCLEIHLLELPKYSLPIHNERITNPIDQWLYFFRSAASSTPSGLIQTLADPVFAEATGVLEMIVRSPQERMAYEARQKFFLDQQSLLRSARSEGVEQGRAEGRAEGVEQGRAEGVEQGRAEGELIGAIQAYRQVLGVSTESKNDLTALSLEQLRELIDELQTAIQNRFPS